MVEAAFEPLDPRSAQHHMPVANYAIVLAELKPKFNHHPQSKVLIQTLLAEMGCDLEQTYFDVPRMQTSTAKGFLTAGIAYASHPHHLPESKRSRTDSGQCGRDVFVI